MSTRTLLLILGGFAQAIVAWTYLRGTSAILDAYTSATAVHTAVHIIPFALFPLLFFYPAHLVWKRRVADAALFLVATGVGFAGWVTVMRV